MFRFIGELYKLGMLTARIMHECVRKLLAVDPSDEESHECLCRLVTTVGQNLDNLDIETKSKGPVQGLCDMSNYFKEMNKLVNEKKTSSRLRFLLQDLSDEPIPGAALGVDTDPAPASGDQAPTPSTKVAAVIETQLKSFVRRFQSSTPARNAEQALCL